MQALSQLSYTPIGSVAPFKRERDYRQPFLYTNAQASYMRESLQDELA